MVERSSNVFASKRVYVTATISSGLGTFLAYEWEKQI